METQPPSSETPQAVLVFYKCPGKPRVPGSAHTLKPVRLIGLGYPQPPESIRCEEHGMSAKFSGMSNLDVQIEIIKMREEGTELISERLGKPSDN